MYDIQDKGFFAKVDRDVIYPYVNKLVIDPLTKVSEYVGLRFNVLERDEDLTLGGYKNR